MVALGDASGWSGDRGVGGGFGSGRSGGGEGEVMMRGSSTFSSAGGVGGGSSSGISGSASWVRCRWNGGRRVRVYGVDPLCLVFLLPRMRRGSCGDSVCDDLEGLVVGTFIWGRTCRAVEGIGICESGVVNSGSGGVWEVSVCIWCARTGDGEL